MSDSAAGLALVASQPLPFSPLSRPRSSAKPWVICGGVQALVLNTDFEVVDHFDFTKQLRRGAGGSTVNLNADATIAVAVRWPDVFVQMDSREIHATTPHGDLFLSSSAAVLEDACYFVQPPQTALTENNEIDDLVLARLDYASGEITSIAPLPIDGDYYEVIDAGEDLAVVTYHGQDGSSTAGISKGTGQSTLRADLEVGTFNHHHATGGGSTTVVQIGIDSFSPDGTWFVSQGTFFNDGAYGIAVAAWPSWDMATQWAPAEQEQTLYPIILGNDRLAVWEVDTTHLDILDPFDLQRPVDRIDLPSGHKIIDGHGDRFVTVKDQTAYLWEHHSGV